MGSFVGGVVGSPVGTLDELSVGILDGPVEGLLVGILDGLAVEGTSVGILDGPVEGPAVEGSLVGIFDRRAVNLRRWAYWMDLDGPLVGLRLLMRNLNFLPPYCALQHAAFLA